MTQLYTIFTETKVLNLEESTEMMIPPKQGKPWQKVAEGNRTQVIGGTRQLLDSKQSRHPVPSERAVLGNKFAIRRTLEEAEQTHKIPESK